MRETQFKQVVILSAELSNLTTKQNERRTSNLENSLQELGIAFSKGIGVYKNSVETCFVCVPKNNTEVGMLEVLGLKSFNQESILLRDTQGDAHLVFQDNTKEHLGVLKGTSRAHAWTKDAHTYVNGQYYIAA